jgi:signal transduction histidine kinase
LVRVPVALPRGKIAIYAIYRDITASKQAAAALKEANEQLHELSGRMLRMQDDEHRRIARELHDSIAQELVAVSMNLSELQKRIDGKDPMSDNIISDSIAILEQCNGEIRTISHLLHPALLDELGLTRALRHYVEGFAERSGIATTLDVAPQLGPLPRAVEATLFRVVQESLANVLRHSGSQTATVRLQPTDQGVELEIVDHGHGFPRALVTSDGAVAGLGVGILGMRERLRQFGGHLDLQSTATGAVVRAKVPLPRDSS